MDPDFIGGIEYIKLFSQLISFFTCNISALYPLLEYIYVIHHVQQFTYNQKEVKNTI